MNNIKLIKTLNHLEKDFFTLKDLEKILPVKKKSLYTTVSRLVKREVLTRIGKNLYTFFGKTAIPEEIAPVVYYPSYLSLNTVLAKKGIINQIPQKILLITSQKSKKIKIANTLVSYRQIKENLFYGWYLDKQIPTAYPEKALLDLVYFASLGRAYLPINELDLSSLDINRWNKFKKNFPETAQKLIKKLEEKIAKGKMDDLNTTNLEAAKKIIAGSARSMGVEIK